MRQHPAPRARPRLLRSPELLRHRYRNDSDTGTGVSTRVPGSGAGHGRRASDLRICSAALSPVARSHTKTVCFTLPVPWAVTARHNRRRHLASTVNYAASIEPMQTPACRVERPSVYAAVRTPLAAAVNDGVQRECGSESSRRAPRTFGESRMLDGMARPNAGHVSASSRRTIRSGAA